jgi:hypothetical protein
MAVAQDDTYPEFPKLKCSVCGEKFDMPRQWVSIPGLGEQIIMGWKDSEILMKAHHDTHIDELITGVEGYLRANS